MIGLVDVIERPNDSIVRSVIPQGLTLLSVAWTMGRLDVNGAWVTSASRTSSVNATMNSSSFGLLEIRECHPPVTARRRCVIMLLVLPMPESPH